MKSDPNRAKARRGGPLRLERLEERNLLSAAAGHVGGIHAAVLPTRAALYAASTFTGKVTGTPAPSGLFTPNALSYYGFSGLGTARGQGRIFFNAQQSVSRNTSTVPSVLEFSNGQATLTDLRGNVMYIAYNGAGEVTGPSGDTDFLSGLVTGGTGRFAYASGTFTANAKNLEGLGKFSLSYTVTLDSPR